MESTVLPVKRKPVLEAPSLVLTASKAMADGIVRTFVDQLPDDSDVNDPRIQNSLKELVGNLRTQSPRLARAVESELRRRRLER